MIGGLSVYIAGLAIHLTTVIPFPYPVHFEDGPVLNAALTLARGDNVYVDNSSPPFVSSNYMPLYYIPYAILVGLHGPNLGALRLLCLLNTILLGLVIYRWISWRTESREAAIIATAMLFTFFPVANWGAAVKADTMAVLFSMVGAYLVDRYARGWGFWLSVPLLALAFFTKQTQVAAASAAILYLLLRSPLRAIRFGLLYVTTIAVPFLAIDLLTGHGLYRHVVEYNSSQAHWFWRGKQLLKTFLLNYSGYLLVAVGSAFWLLKQYRMPLPVIYFCTSFLTTATVISDGADFNHYLETATVASLLVGLGLGQLVLHSRFPLLKLTVLVILTIQVALRVPSVLPGMYAAWAYTPETTGRGAGILEPPLWLGTPTKTVQLTGDQLLKEIQLSQGPVLVELSAFAALAGRPIELDDPYIFASLSRSNKWLQEPVLEKLRKREYSLVALLVDVRPAGSHHTRFTDEMIEAIRTNYRLEKSLAYPVLEGPLVYLYRPNSRDHSPLATGRRD